MDVPEAQQTPSISYGPPSTLWLCGALAAALIALAGSLYLSIGMELKACPLCFYQRTFVMATVGVLVIGLFAGGFRTGLVGLLALPLAFGGIAVAAYHYYLESTGFLECPLGIASLGSAPMQSLLIQLCVVGLLLTDVIKRGQVPGAVASMIVGGLLAFGGIKSVPSSVAPDYNRHVDSDGCRPAKK
ncbi:MAG: disulfide bond formation protein B [Gemmataceae bacterium]|nr:disulfide bond formation protein B [Gemmataceae bacterium]